MRLEGNVTVLQGPALRGDTRTHALSSYFLTPVSVALGGGFFPFGHLGTGGIREGEDGDEGEAIRNLL